ncbi:MAG: type II toxin-antitoxin system VapC family toxin [Planctomycetaceae bacterium]
MRLLLDTHALYWYVEGDQKLTETAQSLIQDFANEVFISPASYWEIAIKLNLGKWILNRPYDEFIELALVQYEFQVLHITPAHTTRLIGLQYPDNHRDPFDRLLVAQAIAESMPIISADSKFDAYGVTRLW